MDEVILRLSALEQLPRILRGLQIPVGHVDDRSVQKALETQHPVKRDALHGCAAPDGQRLIGCQRRQRLAQRDRQPRRHVRLEHIVDVLRLVGVHEVAGIAGEKNDPARRHAAVDLLGQRDSVCVRQTDVQHGDIRPVVRLPDRRQRRARGLKCLNGMRHLPERVVQDLHGPVEKYRLIIAHRHLKHSPVVSFSSCP